MSRAPFRTAVRLLAGASIAQTVARASISCVRSGTRRPCRHAGHLEPGVSGVRRDVDAPHAHAVDGLDVRGRGADGVVEADRLAREGGPPNTVDGTEQRVVAS